MNFEKLKREVQENSDSDAVSLFFRECQRRDNIGLFIQEIPDRDLRSPLILRGLPPVFGRQIEKEASEIFFCGGSYYKSNTEVCNDSLYLFGNKIAWWGERKDSYYISTRGYNTRTTKSRLKSLLFSPTVFSAKSIQKVSYRTGYCGGLYLDSYGYIPPEVNFEWDGEEPLRVLLPGFFPR